MARRSTRIKANSTETSENVANASEAGAKPKHRKADQPKGVLRPSINKTATTTTEPTQVQTAVDPLTAIRLMPKEFEAVVGLRRLQLGLDGYEARQRELARLEAEDPIGYYYAQTPAERAPYQLQAASVLFQMSGGDIREPVAALTMMKMEREEELGEKRKAMAMLLEGWRAAKAKKEAGEAAEMVQEEAPKKRGRKRKAPVEETGADEPPKKKSVRFGRSA